LAKLVGDLGTAALLASSGPLYQTSFLPDLTHVNFLPPLVLTEPTYEQVAPALTAAEAGTTNTDPRSAVATARVNAFFITQSARLALFLQFLEDL
jgi:hypothetical protein